MSFNVVILKSAQRDLKEIRDYIADRFSQETWLITSAKLKNSLKALEESPLSGSIPPELEMLGLGVFRQVVSGMNRIIYEVQQDVVFVHVIADTRRDMTTLLTKRLLLIAR